MLLGKLIAIVALSSFVSSMETEELEEDVAVDGPKIFSSFSS